MADLNNESFDDNTEEINEVKIYLKKLIQIISTTVLNEIRDEFQQHKNGKLNDTILRAILESKFNILLSDEDFKQMYAKIDITKQGTITFLQFVNYLKTESELKGKQHKQNSSVLLKLMPSKSTKGDEHKKRKMTMITFNPLLDQKDNGEYITINENGNMLVFTPELEWKFTYGRNEVI